MTIEEFIAQFTILHTFPNSGQKAVHLASHPKYGNVVIKIGKFPNETRLKRAKKEVDILKMINSVYYPKNIDFIFYPDNSFIIVEEFIDSNTLTSSRMNYNTPAKILNLLKEIVTGLTVIWDKDITHRDIKSDNLLIRKSNDLPVIVDLGIVLSTDGTPLTDPSFRGPCTPPYSAPEQLKYRRADIDHRTDQFVLGIVIMEIILNGEHPFDPRLNGKGGSIEENIIDNVWLSSKLDEKEFLPLKPLISKMLAPEPYLRFRNASLLIAEINDCLNKYNTNVV